MLLLLFLAFLYFTEAGELRRMHDLQLPPVSHGSQFVIGHFVSNFWLNGIGDSWSLENFLVSFMPVLKDVNPVYGRYVQGDIGKALQGRSQDLLE